MYKLFSTYLTNKFFFFIKNQIYCLLTVLVFFLLSSCSSPKENSDFNTDSSNNKLNVLFIIADDFMAKNTNEKKPFYLQISHYAVHASIQSK